MSDDDAASRIPPAEGFTPEELEAGRRVHASDQVQQAVIAVVFALAMLAMLAGARWVHRRIYRSVGWWPELMLYVVAAWLVMAALETSIALARQRSRRKIGLAFVPTRMWWRSALVGSAAGLCFTVGLTTAMWGIARLGTHSWLFALPVPFVLGLATALVGRAFLGLQMPIEPLKDARCRAFLDDLAAKCSVAVPRAYLLRSSAWSPSVNAAVIADGRGQALIVFDTALELPDDELRVLLAHELAHVRRRDGRTIGVVAGLVTAAAVAFAFAVLPWTSVIGMDDIRLDATTPVARSIYDPVTATLGLPECRLPSGRQDFDCVERLTDPQSTTPHRGRPLAYVDQAILVFCSVSLGTIARGLWQRDRERDADVFALETTRDPDAFVRLIHRATVSAGAAADIAPHVGCTHATAATRMALARAWADQRGLPRSGQSSGT